MYILVYFSSFDSLFLYYKKYFVFLTYQLEEEGLPFFYKLLPLATPILFSRI